MPPFMPKPRHLTDIDRDLSKAVRLRRDLLARVASIELEAEREVRGLLVNLCDLDAAITDLVDLRSNVAKLLA